MPLIGLSANFIPYVMAMVFTMLFLNGNAVKENGSFSMPAKSNVNQLTFTENTGATPSEVHYSALTSITTLSADNNLRNIFIGDSNNGLPPSYYFIRPYNSHFFTISHRGPPLS